MGLGPPVCQHCQVLGNLGASGWYCEFCGETNLTEHTGFDPDVWNWLENREKLLRDNQRFLKFVQGEDPDAPTSPRS